MYYLNCAVFFDEKGVIVNLDPKLTLITTLEHFGIVCIDARNRRLLDWIIVIFITLHISLSLQVIQKCPAEAMRYVKRSNLTLQPIDTFASKYCFE